MSRSAISRVEAEAIIHNESCVEHVGLSSLLQKNTYVLRDGRVVVMDRENSNQPVVMLWDSIDELFESCESSNEQDPVVSDVISGRLPSAETFISQIDDWIIRLQRWLKLDQPVALTSECAKEMDDRFEGIGEQCLDDVTVFCGLTALIGKINCRTRAMHWGISKYGEHIVPVNVDANGRVEFPFDELLRIEDGALWEENECPAPFRPIELCTHGWSMCLP